MEKETINKVMFLCTSRKDASSFVRELTDGSNQVSLELHVECLDYHNRWISNAAKETAITQMLKRHLKEIKEEAKAMLADIDKQLEEL